MRSSDHHVPALPAGYVAGSFSNRATPLTWSAPSTATTLPRDRSPASVMDLARRTFRSSRNATSRSRPATIGNTTSIAMSAAESAAIAGDVSPAAIATYV